MHDTTIVFARTDGRGSLSLSLSPLLGVRVLFFSSPSPSILVSASTICATIITRDEEICDSQGRRERERQDVDENEFVRVVRVYAGTAVATATAEERY